ncbi:MAG: ribonuclease D [Candidatus Fonsibacter sp.]|nr:ribonuclease D [Pelagibacterales bacterium]
MEVKILKQDLPKNINLGEVVAVDTETMGLDFSRDRLCLVQLSPGDNKVYIIQIDKESYQAENLKKILEDKKIKKIFQYARFDLAVLKKYLNVEVNNVYCTKIASRIGRTYSDKHGLKDLCKELLNIELSKAMQSSDWGAEELSKEQIQYAASDVLYLHKIKNELDKMLKRENRLEIAEQCFNFLKHRVALDLAGWNNQDIFSH